MEGRRYLLGDTNDTAGETAASVTSGGGELVTAESEIILILVDNNGATIKVRRPSREKGNEALGIAIRYEFETARLLSVHRKNEKESLLPYL